MKKSKSVTLTSMSHECMGKVQNKLWTKIYHLAEYKLKLTKGLNDMKKELLKPLMQNFKKKKEIC